MDKIAHDIRRQKWLTIVQNCNAGGQPKSQWCEENGIDRRKFFY